MPVKPTPPSPPLPRPPTPGDVVKSTGVTIFATTAEVQGLDIPLPDDSGNIVPKAPEIKWVGRTILRRVGSSPRGPNDAEV